MQDLTASLCFRGQRIFLHNASGWFGDAPLEASGDFGINPENGEFHLMCQVSLTFYHSFFLAVCCMSEEVHSIYMKGKIINMNW